MFLTPPQYNGYPVSQNDFINQTNKNKTDLANQKKRTSVAALTQPAVGTITQVKHLRDGKPYTKIQYNKFYKDWKTDTTHNTIQNTILPQYPRTSNTSNTSNTANTSRTIFNTMPDKPYKYYDKPDAIPLATNGFNNINILFNDNCLYNTFNYRNFIKNKHQEYINPIYNVDITQDTQKLHEQYLNNITQNNIHLYTSIYEDMHIMSVEHTGI